MTEGAGAAPTLLGYTVACLLQLRQRRQAARVLCAMTGSLLIVVGLVLVATGQDERRQDGDQHSDGNHDRQDKTQPGHPVGAVDGH